MPVAANGCSVIIGEADGCAHADVAATIVTIAAGNMIFITSDSLRYAARELLVVCATKRVTGSEWPASRYNGAAPLKFQEIGYPGVNAATTRAERHTRTWICELPSAC